MLSSMLAVPAPGRPVKYADYPTHWWGDVPWMALREASRHPEVTSAIDAAVANGAIAAFPLKQDDVKQNVDAVHAAQRAYRFAPPATAGGGLTFVRTLSDIRAEVASQAESIDWVFADTFQIDAVRRPASALLLAKCTTWSVPFIMYCKSRFALPRPQQLDPTIRTLLPCPLHPSFPSGHASQAYLIAKVIGRIAPGFKAELEAVAADIANLRVVAGVHFPIDSIGGDALATVLEPLFWTHFAVMRAAAEQEWRDPESYIVP